VIRPPNDMETIVLNLLAEAWNNFLTLPVLHPDDQHEFREAIHQAQNIVLARAHLRDMEEAKVE
jgi:hypothetical protein